jgi:hypothetical protein
MLVENASIKEDEVIGKIKTIQENGLLLNIKGINLKGFKHED